MKCKVLCYVSSVIFSPSHTSLPPRVDSLTADLHPRHFCSVQWNVHLLAKKFPSILNLLKDIFILPIVLTKPGFHQEHFSFTILSSEGCPFFHEHDTSRSGKRRSDPSCSTWLLLPHWSPAQSWLPEQEFSAVTQGPVLTSVPCSVIYALQSPSWNPSQLL